MAEKDIYDQMAEEWPSVIVSRTRIAEFTGGLISPGYIANLDSRGKGPPGRIRNGRKTAYVKSSLVEWLRNRSTVAGYPCHLHRNA